MKYTVIVKGYWVGGSTILGLRDQSIFKGFASEIQNAKKFIGAIHCAGRGSRHCKISLVVLAWTHVHFFAMFSFAFLVVTALIRVATFFVFVATVVDVLLDLTGVLFATSFRITALKCLRPFRVSIFFKQFCVQNFTTFTLGQNLDDSLRPNPIPSSLSPPVSRVPFPPSLLPTLPSGVQCHEV